MVHVCRDHKIILIPDQGEQVPINRLGRVDIAVEINMPCPPCPAGLLVREGIKAAGVHVPDPEVLFEIKEIPVEPLTAVGEARSGGKTCSGADHDRVGSSDLIFQPADVLLPAACLIS